MRSMMSSDTKDLNKEKDFVYLINVNRSTYSLHDVLLAVLIWKIKFTRSETKFISLFLSSSDTFLMF